MVVDCSKATKFQLSNALFNKDNVVFINVVKTGHGGHIAGQVTSIQWEDGSGKCFNVTVATPITFKTITFFVRTID